MIDQTQIKRIARLSVKKARLALKRKGFNGEALRMQYMSDMYAQLAVDLLECHWERVKMAKASVAVNQLSNLVRMRCLQAEINVKTK